MEAGRTQDSESDLLSDDGLADTSGMAADLVSRFKEALGVKLTVEIVSSGSLDELTLVSKQTKPRRLIDLRKS